MLYLTFLDARRQLSSSQNEGRSRQEQVGFLLLSFLAVCLPLPFISSLSFFVFPLSPHYLSFFPPVAFAWLSVLFFVNIVLFCRQLQNSFNHSDGCPSALIQQLNETEASLKEEKAAHVRTQKSLQALELEATRPSPQLSVIETKLTELQIAYDKLAHTNAELMLERTR